MKRFWGVIAIATLALGVGLLGCEKKGEEGKAEDSKAATDTAAKKTADEAKPETVDMKAADKKMDEAAKELEGAMAKGGGNADDAPEYMKEMVGHLKEINTLTKDNMDDCEKAGELLQAYVKDNEAKLQELSKQADADKKDMSPEEKQKMAQSAMALIGPLMQDMMKTQMQFAKKCPNEATALQNAMQSMKMK